MIRKRSALWALLGSALLVACGGDDVTVPGSGSPSGAPTAKGNFTALVTFGDSLSDQGSYAPATSLSGNGHMSNCTNPQRRSFSAHRLVSSLVSNTPRMLIAYFWCS